jgi:hypothetical protein
MFNISDHYRAGEEQIWEVWKGKGGKGKFQ